MKFRLIINAKGKLVEMNPTHAERRARILALAKLNIELGIIATNIYW